MTQRPEFPRKVKLAAWTRAGGPDDPRCECYLVARRPDTAYEDCGRQPITRSDPPEYHHLDEAESGDTPERRAYLKSLANCACLRRSCHRVVSDEVTTPKVVKSRHQREQAAGIKRQPTRVMPGSRAHHLKKKADGSVVDRRTGEVVWPR